MSESYLPLFRKYRPQSFADLVGQENLVRALTNAIELNRIANAYLFCGPRGTGKTSSARIFAKSLNCEKGPSAAPCQNCASCIDITNATGMDVIEIDAATNRGVDDAQELISQVQYAPMYGKYKIFIIDEVHMLTPQAFNALLKTFEEPPENVIFILATTEPQKVLETIVSRCQRFDFRRITVGDIQKRLREISDKENIKITDDALFTIAKNVSGGLRDSLALLDQVSILGAKEEISKDMIEELLGKVTFDRLDNLLEMITNCDIEGALKLIDEIYLKGSEPRNLCENFMEFLRNVIVILNSKNPQDVINFTTLSKVDIQKILDKKYDPSRCAQILDIAIDYYKEIKFATNPYLWAELMVIRAARENILQITENIVPKKETAAQKAQPQQKPAQTQVEKAQIAQPQEQKTPSVPKPEVKQPETVAPKPEVKQPENTAPQALPAAKENENAIEIWGNIVNSIESVPAKFFYSGMAKLVGVEENRIILGFINQNVITSAKSDLKHKALLQGEKNAYGGKYNFEFVQLGGNIKALEGASIKPQVVQEPQTKPAVKQYENTYPQNDTKPAAASNTDAKAKQDNDAQKEKNTIDSALYSPKVKEMLDAFSGKIIE